MGGGRCECVPAVRNGAHYNEFVADHFGECLYSDLELASFLIGMSSIAFWTACQLPQFITNVRKRSAAALSRCFLLEWFLGDALNLLGAILTHQLVTQKATATMFIVNDSIMLSQMLFYSRFGVDRVRKDNMQGHNTNQYSPLLEEDDESLEEDYGSVSYGENVLFAIHGASLDVEGSEEENSVAERGRSGNGDGERNEGAGRSLNSRVLAIAMPLVIIFVVGVVQISGDAPKHESNSVAQTVAGLNKAHLPNCEESADVSPLEMELGTMIGWVSAVIYLFSRIPQILKNQRRQSVDGLSFLMFFCAVMGNVSYGLGVILRDSSRTALSKALPWLTGSLGTLLLDFTILMQFWYFNGKDLDNEEEDDDYLEYEPIGPSGRLEAIDEGPPASIHNESMSSMASSHRKSKERGIFGIRAWDTSPFLKPRLRDGVSRPPPLDLRNTTSLGVLPSETSFGSLESFRNSPPSSGNRPPARSFTGSMHNRSVSR